MPQRQKPPPLHIVIVGHVDHGKSTFIGRLLYDTDSLPAGKYDALKKVCKDRGTEALEWSFLLDAFQAERNQAITIDTTQIGFSTQERDYVIIDAPGHREFIKNMISGAAQADGAILVVDATQGVREQTRRHAYLLSLLGLTQISVVINKMDMVGYDAEIFANVRTEITAYLKSIGLKSLHILPISARHGDMIAARGEHLKWYNGPCLTEALDSFHHAAPEHKIPLRFPVQDVYRFDGKRIVVGRVETGTLCVGDRILFSPTNEQATIATIETWPKNINENKIRAMAGESIGITLDEAIFVERGHMGAHTDALPVLSNLFHAQIFWLPSTPLKMGNTYKMRCTTREVMVTVHAIAYTTNTDTLERTYEPNEVGRDGVAHVTLRASEILPLDSYAANAQTGRIVLYDGHDVVGGGHIKMDGIIDQRLAVPVSKNISEVSHLLSYEERAQRQGHHGGVFWLTGLSGSGKSTLAMKVEHALFDKGCNVYVLDGDNIRHGLNADLGFSPEDRTENIRRIGEVAALMADAGFIVITAFISPHRADRHKARMAATDRFHTLHINADLETCERRDPKGLYKKSRAGEIQSFTGIDAPYDIPKNPELIIDTQHNDVETCTQQVLRYIESKCV